MGFVRSSLSVVAASALGAGLFVAAPAQAAQYPPTKPIRCGAVIQGNDIGVKIRPLDSSGHKFEVQKRVKKNKWKVVRTGRTNANEGTRWVRNLDSGRYRVKCYGAPDRLDGITSSGRIR